ncbi:MAG TPA: tripartite tricarboxylate transporter substrate-binding protein [Beijerinckiaceae bacterium]|jgi:tripartite-type tricarboxylate transporter receptor subunit TctC
MFMQRRSLLAGLLALSAAAVSPAQAANFYEGKTVTMILPHSASGSFAKYAQLLAPAIAKQLKARTVRVEHHSGAGGMVGSNLVWHAKPDGLTFGLTSGPALVLAQLGQAEGVQFDAVKFTYLGRPALDDRVIFVGAKSPIKSVEDVTKLGRPFKVPSQGVDEDFYGMAMLADILGFKVQFITGFEGGGDTTLTVVKGETDGRLTSWTSALPMLKTGDIRPILSVGEQRNPEHPNVANALELVADPVKKKTIQALINIQRVHRSFFGPPNMPPAVVDELRAGIMAALTDPQVQEAAKKAGLPINAMDGATQQKVVAEIYEASGDISRILKTATDSIK